MQLDKALDKLINEYTEFLITDDFISYFLRDANISE